MITAGRLKKFFGKLVAINDVSFEIFRGEIVGFLGRNGAGKTTLMRLLTSYLPLDSGKLSIFSKDIRKDSLKIRRHIGYLPETPPLYTSMSVIDYLRYAAWLKDVPVKQQKKKIQEVLDVCKLGNVEKKPISILSKGYKQRIGIAQAILNDPELLILDEPTNGLDPSQILEVRKLIRNLEEKRTVIVSTHILSEIEQLASRVLIIDSGRIVKDDSLERLLSGEKHKREMLLQVSGSQNVIVNILKNADAVTLLRIDPQAEGNQFSCYLEIEERADINDLLEAFISAQCHIGSLSEKRLSLEEIFLRITDPKK